MLEATLFVRKKMQMNFAAPKMKRKNKEAGGNPGCADTLPEARFHTGKKMVSPVQR